MPGQPRTLQPDTGPRLLGRRVWRGAAEEPENRAEVAQYLARGTGRFAETLAAFGRALDRRNQDARVLELGSEPWLFTQLLLERDLDVTAAGFRPHEEADRERVGIEWAGRQAVVEQHLFDVEHDRWPFADGSFDCVLCLEVLEHLTFSPAHMLYEANRVLAPRGTLLLSTPNALAAPKLVALLRGRTVHWAYSGYGAQGRHNREFAPDEVRTVLEAANFDVGLRTANLAGYEAADPLARMLQRLATLGLARARRRRDHIFALARKAGPPRLAFPAPLYRSYDRALLRRLGVTLPDESGPPEADARAHHAAGDGRGLEAGLGGPP